MKTALTKRSKSTRRRSLGATRPQPTTAITVTSATALGAVLTVTFDQPIALNGTPAYTTDVVGALPVSAVQTDPMTLEITFSASIAAATEVRIPYEEACVRNASGGFVSTSTFPVGA